MSLRKISITLFAVIGLLLGTNVGLHIWHLSSPETAMMVTTIEMKSNVMIPELSAEMESSPTEPTLLVERNISEVLSSADSLAIIELFLIPSANAEAAGSADRRRNSIIEDETLGALRELKEGLDKRNKVLDQRELSLQQAEEQLKRRITELEQLEASIEQRLLDESKVKSKKIKRLTAVYEGMKPERSAPVIARMELATVVKIFLLMDEKKVGKILSYLSPEKAVTISHALTRQISAIK